MRTPAPPGGDYRGRHQRTVLASFRPTWRQGLARGFCLGTLGTAALVTTASAVVTAPALVDVVVGTALRPRALPELVWLVVLAPLPIGMLCGVAGRCRVGVRFDEAGVQKVPVRPDGFVPWRLVTDVRLERRRWRTVIAVYLEDGTARRLPAPYDGSLLGRDPFFERKVFLIWHLWAAYREWSVHS
jgi:hypothetical protein